MSTTIVFPSEENPERNSPGRGITHKYESEKIDCKKIGTRRNTTRTGARIYRSPYRHHGNCRRYTFEDARWKDSLLEANLSGWSPCTTGNARGTVRLISRTEWSYIYSFHQGKAESHFEDSSHTNLGLTNSLLRSTDNRRTIGAYRYAKARR